MTASENLPTDEDSIPTFLTQPDAANESIRPRNRWIGPLSVIAIIFWITCASVMVYIAYDLGARWQTLLPIQAAGLALLIIAPALMMAVTAYAFRQLSKLSYQSFQLQKAANHLSQPNEAVVAKTAIMTQAVKAEIDTVDQRMDSTLNRMQALETHVKEQVSTLEAAVNTTEMTSKTIATTLTQQRDDLQTMATELESYMQNLSEVMRQHVETLSRSTTLSEQKVEEARVSVEGAAAKINAASDIVRGNTIEAATTLKSNHGEIQQLGEEIRERSAELDSVYRKHANDLSHMIEQLRDEQENLGLSLEARLEKMRDMSLSAKVSAESLTKASTSGRETVEALAEAAKVADTAVKKRFEEMEDLVRYSSTRAESITETAARRVQDSLGQTRKEIARIENDMAALQDRLNQRQTEMPTSIAPVKLKKTAKPKSKKRKPIQIQPLPDIEPSEAPSPHVISQTQPDAIIDPPIDLSLDIPDSIHEDDLVLPDPDDALTGFDPEALRRAIPEAQGGSKPKNRWSWRDILPSLDRTNDKDTETKGDVTNPLMANSDDTSQTSTVSEVPSHLIDVTGIISALTTIGLGPNAIIDEGCIIEAATLHVQSGPDAMSHALAERIGEPVLHLKNNLADNSQLAQDITAFVAHYRQRLQTTAGDIPTLQMHLENDSGRTFILCDAAINGLN